MFAGKQGLNCVQSEIHNVLSALRRNGRWATAERFDREIPVQFEKRLIRLFKELRDVVSARSTLQEIDSLYFLSPFLHVIQSPSTSSRATARALVSINKFILYGALTEISQSAREAVNFAVESICECQFESNDMLSDEVVLAQLLETLVNVFRSQCGSYVSDTNSWRIIETCWKLRSESSSSTLLRSAAANSLIHTILTIFSKSDELLDESTHNSGYGIELMLKVLHFLASLTEIGKNSMATRAFALQLINIVLETAGTSLSSNARIIQVLQGALCKNLLENSQESELTIFSSTLRVIFNLFSTMKGHLKVQLEVFLISVHFRVTEGDFRNEMKELALESLVDFCRQPLMILDIYINYDCDFNCTNLFETLIKTLSKRSLPIEQVKRINSLHTSAFQGLIAIVDQVSNFGGLSYRIEEVDNHHELKKKKAMKRKLQICAAEFNRKPLKELWVKVAVQEGLLDEDPSPTDLAKFLLNTPGLDKTKIGDFLGDLPTDDVWAKTVSSTLKEFMSCMHLNGLRIDTAIRKVLTEFRLPGEAQKIDRIMDAFGNELYQQNKSKQDSKYDLGNVLDGNEESDVYDVFENADSAFTLAFSIIMLHTDLHNDAIKPEKKMTFEQFVRNNRGINNGKNFSESLLSKIYEKTKNEQMKMLYNPSDLQNSSPNELIWENILSHSKNVNESITVTNDVAKYISLLKDMYNIVFDVFLSTSLEILRLTRDGKVVLNIFNALYQLVSVSAFFREDEKIDKIVCILCDYFDRQKDYIGHVNKNKVPPEVQKTLKIMSLHRFNFLDAGVLPKKEHDTVELYAASRLVKALLCYNTVVYIAKKYGKSLRASWQSILKATNLLNEANLLPKFFVELDDVIDYRRRNRRKTSVDESTKSATHDRENDVIIDRTTNLKESQETSLTFWGLVSSLLFTDNAEDGATVNEEVAESIKTLLSVWELRKIFVNVRSMGDKSNSYLIEALNMTLSPGFSPQNTVLAIELLTEVGLAMSNTNSNMEDSITQILFGYFKALRLAGIENEEITLNGICNLSKEEESSLVKVSPREDIFIVERVVINLLAVSMRMLEKDDAVKVLILRALAWITYLPENIASLLSKKIGMGLGTVLSLNFAQLPASSALWRLFNVMKFYTRFDSAVDHIFNALTQVIIRSGNKIEEDENAKLDLCLEFVQLFLLNPSEKTDKVKTLPALPFKMMSMSLFNELDFNFDFQDAFYSGSSARDISRFDSFTLDSDTNSDSESKFDMEGASLKRKRERLLWSEVRATKSLQLVIQIVFRYYRTENLSFEDLMKILSCLSSFKDDTRELVRHGVRKSFGIVLLRFTNGEDKIYNEGTIYKGLTGIDAEVWMKILNSILIPIVDSIDAPAIESKAFKAENLFSYTKLLMNCFLQKIEVLSKHTEFSILWLKIVTVLCKNIKVAAFFLETKTSVLDKDLCDKMYFSSVEGLKNLLMVLRVQLNWKEEMEASNLLTLTFDLIKTTSGEVSEEVASFLEMYKQDKKEEKVLVYPADSKDEESSKHTDVQVSKGQ